MRIGYATRSALADVSAIDPRLTQDAAILAGLALVRRRLVRRKMQEARGDAAAAEDLAQAMNAARARHGLPAIGASAYRLKRLGGLTRWEAARVRGVDPWRLLLLMLAGELREANVQRWEREREKRAQA